MSDSYKSSRLIFRQKNSNLKQQFSQLDLDEESIKTSSSVRSKDSTNSSKNSKDGIKQRKLMNAACNFRDSMNRKISVTDCSIAQLRKAVFYVGQLNESEFDLIKSMPERKASLEPRKSSLVGAKKSSLVGVQLAKSTMRKISTSAKSALSEKRVFIRSLAIDHENEFPFGESSSECSFDDQQLLDQLEREQIVEKYEKGPDHKDVDPWENPNFELYRTTDRYGFVHKDESMIEEESKRRRIDREINREKKWVQMIEEWNKRHPAKLPERIWKGVPDKLRLIVWQKLLNVGEMKTRHRSNYYHELLMRARLVSKDVKQIDLDINRTYRDNLAFRRRYDIKQRSLFNVLTAYAMMNTEVGYCQGMSQIAAVFLMYMDEEDAFWCMHALLISNKYMMHGFFVPGFPKLKRFQDHYEKVIGRYLPRVRKHLEKSCIPPIYLTKWWFGCFLDRVPFSLALRVWDIFLYYGDSVLIAMALNIMYMHRKSIIKFQMETFMEFIQHRLSENFGFSDDKVMDSLRDCLKRLQNDRMALPPLPKPGSVSEIPVKDFGPILTRSLMDLQSEIAEIHSRCSRSNSLSGRSPIARRLHQRNQTSLSSKAPITQVTEIEQSNRMMRRDVHTGSNIGTQATPSSNIVNTNEYFLPYSSDQAVRRIGSGKDRPRPPPVPDADGFIPISALPRRAQKEMSYNSEQNKMFFTKGLRQPSCNEPVHSYSSSVDTGSTISRVQRGPNNVTYISIGMEGDGVSQNQRQPTPPPDYNDSDNE